MRPIITHVMFLLTMGLVFLLVKLCLNIYATQTELKFPPDLPKFQKSIFIVECQSPVNDQTQNSSFHLVTPTILNIKLSSHS